jgi:hypothetical protein
MNNHKFGIAQIRLGIWLAKAQGRSAKQLGQKIAVLGCLVQCI